MNNTCRAVIVMLLGCVAACSKQVAILTVPEAKRLAESCLDAEVLVTGYYLYHIESDMLDTRPGNQRGIEGLFISFRPMFGSKKGEAAFRLRQQIAQRYDQRLVRLKGVLKYGPFLRESGVRSEMAYLEVSEIQDG